MLANFFILNEPLSPMLIYGTNWYANIYEWKLLRQSCFVIKKLLSGKVSRFAVFIMNSWPVSGQWGQKTLFMFWFKWHSDKFIQVRGEKFEKIYVDLLATNRKRLNLHFSNFLKIRSNKEDFSRLFRLKGKLLTLILEKIYFKNEQEVPNLSEPS